MAMSNFTIAQICLFEAGVFIILFIIVMLILEKEKVKPPKVRNAGCSRCKHYVTEATKTIIIRERPPGQEFPFHCKWQANESYDYVSGTVTYITNSCYDNRAGYCEGFEDVFAPSKLSWSGKIAVKLYKLFRRSMVS